jgi:quercetin dioxygenase-like cupin family protein
MVMVRTIADVPPQEVHMPGVQNVSIRRLISEADGAPTFAMRLFEVKPGGHTPLHIHEHEHEVFILDGRGAVRGPWGEEPLMPGTAVLVPPGEKHHFVNGGDEPLRFLCLVPLEADA